MEGIIRLHEKVQAGVPPAYEIRGVATLTWDGVPGLVEVRRRTARRRWSSSRAARRGGMHLRDEGLQLPLGRQRRRLPRLGRPRRGGYSATAAGT